MPILSMQDLGGAKHPENLERSSRDQKFVGNVTLEQYFAMDHLKTKDLGEIAYNFGGRTRVEPERGLYPFFISETEFEEKLKKNPPDICVMCAQITEYSFLTHVDERDGYTEAGQLCAHCRLLY